MLCEHAGASVDLIPTSCWTEVWWSATDSLWWEPRHWIQLSYRRCVSSVQHCQV